MKYLNPETGFSVTLNSLNDAEKRFYRRALAMFHANRRWLAFDEVIFGMGSPLFAKERSHKSVVDHPLFLALRDMSIQLGVQQGMIRRSGPGEGREPEGVAVECREGESAKAPAGRRRAGRSGRR